MHDVRPSEDMCARRPASRLLIVPACRHAHEADDYAEAVLLCMDGFRVVEQLGQFKVRTQRHNLGVTAKLAPHRVSHVPVHHNHRNNRWHPRCSWLCSVPTTMPRNAWRQPCSRSAQTSAAMATAGCVVVWLGRMLGTSSGHGFCVVWGASQPVPLMWCVLPCL
jgi:hypothetical protein